MAERLRPADAGPREPARRSTIAIAVTVLAALLCAGPTQTVRAQASGAACEIEADFIKQALCFGHTAISENELRACDEARHPAVRFQCYYIYAQHSRDSMICESIPDPLLRDSCLSDVAAALGDPSLCRNVGEIAVRDGCFYDTARKLGDREICAGIADPELRSSCAEMPERAE